MRKKLHPLAAVLLAGSLGAACVTSRGARDGADDPAQGEVALPAASRSWRASLLFDDEGTGVWTVKPFPVFDAFGCPEVVALDDRGRCVVLVSYSGKWTPLPTIEEHAWLGALAHADVDPRVEGRELYVGGRKGNLHQVVAYADGLTDHRRIASFPGRELHTIVAGELDPRSAGPEIFVFTRPGGLHRVAPTGPDGTFESEELQRLDGRVRDAVVLPAQAGAAPEIATVTRAGRLELLRVGPDGPRWTTVHEEPMGMGRVALAPGSAAGGPLVLYSTLDDGRVLRHARTAAGAWSTETIYLGPQGLRGVAAGRFHADPDVETVAVFGYSGRVQLLSRDRGGEAGPWRVETLFEDLDRGHWLSAAELDGRNATDELVGSGYAGRVFMLSRPPGYGRDGIALDPD